LISINRYAIFYKLIDLEYSNILLPVFYFFSCLMKTYNLTFMNNQENPAFLFQRKLFELIKHKLPPKENLARAIAEVLHLGTDAAYKRLSTERLLDIHELMQLMQHYQLQWMDIALPLSPDQLWMQQRHFGSTRNSLHAYLQDLLHTFEYWKKQGCQQVCITQNELGVFQLAAAPELCQFYLFLWQKHVLNLSDFKHQKFSLQEAQATLQPLCEAMYEVYLQLPSLELWVSRTPLLLRQQLQYYQEAGLFDNENDHTALLRVYDKFVEHLALETQEARKIHFITQDPHAPCQRYYHELLSGELALCASLNDSRHVWLQSQSLQVLYTQDAKFTEPFLSNWQGLCHKAIHLNQQNEKWLSAFFKAMQGAG
jgi:hypothetical protein